MNEELKKEVNLLIMEMGRLLGEMEIDHSSSSAREVHTKAIILRGMVGELVKKVKELRGLRR